MLVTARILLNKRKSIVETLKVGREVYLRKEALTFRLDIFHAGHQNYLNNLIQIQGPHYQRFGFIRSDLSLGNSAMMSEKSILSQSKLKK